MMILEISYSILSVDGQSIEKFGAWVKEFRRKNNLNQDQFARLIQYSQSSVSAIENAEFEDVLPFLYRMAHAFKMDATDVMVESGLMDRATAEARKSRSKTALQGYEDLDDNDQELINAIIATMREQKTREQALRGTSQGEQKKKT